MNLGAGMTGGLAYLLRDSIGGYGYNQHSVRLAPVEVREELWLRRVLRKHMGFTDSPRAAKLLDATGPLPFLRVEPLTLPCSVAETWASILIQLRRPAVPSLYTPRPVDSETLPLVLKEGELLRSVQTGLA